MKGSLNAEMRLDSGKDKYFLGTKISRSLIQFTNAFGVGGLGAGGRGATEGMRSGTMCRIKPGQGQTTPQGETL